MNFLKKYSLSVLASLGLSISVYAAGMPIPSPMKSKIFLQEKDSPYELDEGLVVSATDSFVVEPGVMVLMGEYAKLVLRGPVKIAGSQAKPVVFQSVDSTKSWNGFHFISNRKPFEVSNLVVKNAFRNSLFRSRGVFENVHFENNYYGLWVDECPQVFLIRNEFKNNRYALSIRAGSVFSTDSKISNNVYGLYLEAEGQFEGPRELIKDNDEADIRSEAEELSANKKRVNRSIWHRLEADF